MLAPNALTSRAPEAQHDTRLDLTNASGDSMEHEDASEVQEQLAAFGPDWSAVYASVSAIEDTLPQPAMANTKPQQPTRLVSSSLTISQTYTASSSASVPLRQLMYPSAPTTSPTNISNISQTLALASSYHVLQTIAFPSQALNLDWNSPALRWFNNFDDDDPPLNFIDLRTGRECETLAYNGFNELKPSEVPLTEYEPGSLGFHWIINVEAGTMNRRYFRGKGIGEEEARTKECREDVENKCKDEPGKRDLDRNGDAVRLLKEYLSCLKNLDTIPINLWAEFSIKPGFVTQSESVYGDVKAKLLQYGWPDDFRRDEWVRDLPGFVRDWKYEKVRILEEAKRDVLNMGGLSI